LLVWSRSYIERSQGPNDGLVPEDSQRFGRVLFAIEADHWAEIGWSQAYDAPGLYERILRELRRRGK